MDTKITLRKPKRQGPHRGHRGEYEENIKVKLKEMQRGKCGED
jgi:hypothetical protein